MEDWCGFLDEPYHNFLIEIISEVMKGGKYHFYLLVVDSFHIVDISSWITCLDTMESLILDEPQVRSFFSGTFNSEDEALLSAHTEYQSEPWATLTRPYRILTEFILERDPPP